MTYLVAERFKSVQGEGVWAGTPMAFIRFVGCSVGKKVCNACDTAFEQVLPWAGGGEYTAQELYEWARPYHHICLTGGEPFDQDLSAFIEQHPAWGRIGHYGVPRLHVETSGTVLPPYFSELQRRSWICASPKPGWQSYVLDKVHEVKIIVPGLGSGGGWPSLQDALRWADEAKAAVFLQPRNGRHDVDRDNLALCQELVLQHPQLRLSVQLHKLLRVR